MSKRPKLTIEKETIDLFIESLSYIVVLLLICIPAYYYNQLPDKIPIHFDGSGNPDGYGKKEMIWLLPAIGLVMFFVLNQVTKHPHSFNYLKPITEANALHQYTLASRMMRVLNFITSSIFCFITWQSIRVALGQASGLGSLFLFVSLAVMTGVIGFYVYKSNKTD